MNRFLREHVGLRYGLLVGLVGLIQIAAAAVPMVSNRVAVFSLQQAQAAREQCFAQQEIGPNTYVGIENCPLADATPVYDLGNVVWNGYLVSLPPVFVLYFLAGRAAGRTSGRKRSAMGAAVVAALVGGAIYILANTLRTIVLFSPFVVWSPLAIDVFPPYSVGLGDEIGTLLFLLAVLSLCAFLLGLWGGAVVSPRNRGGGGGETMSLMSRWQAQR
jgi:hypothetical protein